ncbi:MAG: response regulator [Campylobacteraceae bacterium]|nr:response regulator [Campylobacteraceae bacterium]
MIDQDFLKTLTILYVEDDKQISESFYDILEKLFLKVILLEDGLSALDIFREAVNTDHPIDAIISDIKLPKLNGLDLLEEVRNYDAEVPFIITTGFYEPENLLKAIKLDVSEFYIKPIDAKEIIVHIQKVCEKRYQESRIIHYQKEIKKYIEVIDQVAIVSRITKHKKYKFVNEFFREVSGYQEDEIIGEKTSIMKPDDMADSIYKELWADLKKGNVWRGKLKHKAKDGVSFFVTSTIFPVFDESDKNKLEYIAIEFLTTEDENQKREFKKKVMYNLKETRRINTVARKKIDDLMEEVKTLEEKLNSYRHFDVLEDKLKMEKKRTAGLNSQIKYYEEQVKQGKNRYEKVSTEITERIYRAESATNQVKRKNITALQEVEFLKGELTTVEKQREKLDSLVEKHAQTISNLEEVIQHQEEQLDLAYDRK